MRAALGSDDAVLHTLALCPTATLDAVFLVAKQELLSVLWTLLDRGEDGLACALISSEAPFLDRLMAWCPPHTVRIPKRYGTGCPSQTSSGH